MCAGVPCSHKRRGEVCSLVITREARNQKGFTEVNHMFLSVVLRGADVQRARRPAPEGRDPGGERAGREPLLHPAECGEGHDKGQNLTAVIGHTDAFLRVLKDKKFFGKFIKIPQKLQNRLI